MLSTRSNNASNVSMSEHFIAKKATTEIASSSKYPHNFSEDINGNNALEAITPKIIKRKKNSWKNTDNVLIHKSCMIPKLKKKK